MLGASPPLIFYFLNQCHRRLKLLHNRQNPDWKQRVSVYFVQFDAQGLALSRKKNVLGSTFISSGSKPLWFDGKKLEHREVDCSTVQGWSWPNVLFSLTSTFYFKDKLIHIILFVWLVQCKNVFLSGGQWLGVGVHKKYFATSESIQWLQNL